ncbi:DNA helicase PcrA [Alicyclobacillus acidoterrestris]|uniref:ATP-dependent DNA helicase n=1 Tax=Alicyclobacillus acidoterrestris (strain ATCC 49025 / DSM 3922 / CIP 106132 / NCIMB 13137 / GD3B) TaxID=1356854 RepID=A0A9E6ZJX0_ALIAG|nr:DNA helicase PcrA [Alicyclobacillus acidoterrestris]UNO50763.1 DNA helicase PcrA [Alicyclobacillus acidoterrestris]
MMEQPSAQSILEGLNPEQQRAVQTTDGPLLIMAGAGSGKTSVLTRRIAYLIAERRVPPWGILAITFTNKAAREMRDRIQSLVGNIGADIWTSTFHALCARILRRDIQHIGYASSFTVLDGADQLSVVKRVMADMNIDVKKYDPKGILHQISQHKNELRDGARVRDMAGSLYERLVGDVYLEYERRLRQNQSLDFDDLIMKTVELFRQSPDTLNYYQNRFTHVHVDEYQDTNHAQYMLVKLLADKRKNLCVVGDSDQSIYGWRGADIRNILDFERDYPDAQVIRLEQNYRSTGRILRIANQVIQNNRKRLEKNLWTSAGEGEKATLHHASDERAEAVFVAGQIESLVKQGYKYPDFGVLYRTNAQSRVIEEIFLQKGIPYRIYGGLKFYDRKEIRDVLAYLRLVLNPDDDVSFARVVNVPKRGLGQTTVDRLEAYARDHNCSLFDAAQKAVDAGVSKRAASALAGFVQLILTFQQQRAFLPLTDLTEELLSRSGYREALQLEKTLEAQSRLENLDEFLSLTREFDENGAQDTEVSALEQFLTDVALVADSDLNKGKPESQEESEGVTMMTLHSAKGLEFPVVFLVGMEEGIFPHKRALDEEDEMEEERRLCYVGITRAMQRLFLTTCSSRMIFGERRPFTTSRFLAEMPAQDVEKDGVFFQAKSDYSSAFRQNSSTAPAANASFHGSRMTMPQSFGADLSVSYEPGDKVEHRKWGIGEIISRSGSGESLELVVRFLDPVGERKLFAKFAPITKVAGD